VSGAEPGNAGDDDRKSSLPAVREFYDQIIAGGALLGVIVRHVEEQLLAMPPRGFESASSLRGQTRRQDA
jgi:hypothetical protein